MADQNGNGRAPELTPEERVELATAAHEALGKANTSRQTAEVWSQFYLRLGHRVLGRLMLGQTVDQALRRKASKAEPVAA